MELQEIIDRYAEAFAHVDNHPQQFIPINPGTGLPWATALKPLGETKAVTAVDAAWDHLHPGELEAGARTNVPYPAVRGAKCDHVFSTAAGGDEPEWGIEVKKIEFVGRNGKKNDYGVGKVLSPYYKDRGMLHDALRLREHGFTQRIAVIGYAFTYDQASCDEALRRYPEANGVVDSMREVVRSNGVAIGPRQLIDFADAILGVRGYLRGPRVQADFAAWGSVTGGLGTVWGWEIRRPWLEADYDERHPW